MMLLGCHVQMKSPLFLEGSVKEALSYGCDGMMLYTGAPQNTRRREIKEMHVQEAQQLMKEHGLPMERMIIHAPYIINLANSVKPEVAELAVSFLQEELKRVEEIGAKYLVLHPGSFTTTDLETGIATIISQLNQIAYYPKDVVICLETMAGKGSEVGFQFEQIAEILKGVAHPESFGVCLDTCHIHDAGYDLKQFDAVLNQLDAVIGLDRLHVIHLNDSKNVCGARKDRHANIGFGEIGFDVLHSIAAHPRIAHVLKILETPYVGGKPPYALEIAMLREGSFHPETIEGLAQQEEGK